ncbi:MAG TPA: hypothetical protein VM580_03080 [Labilithrix sp.]|nr:hypothetical protein [Labilithrix sp.]
MLLFLGLVPFDRHHLTLDRIYNRGFDEESWSWLQRRWRHERRVEPMATGCIVTDRLTISPRFAPAALVLSLVRRIFAARHEKLRARFGTPVAEHVASSRSLIPPPVGVHTPGGLPTEDRELLAKGEVLRDEDRF